MVIKDHHPRGRVGQHPWTVSCAILWEADQRSDSQRIAQHKIKEHKVRITCTRKNGLLSEASFRSIRCGAPARVFTAVPLRTEGTGERLGPAYVLPKQGRISVRRTNLGFGGPLEIKKHALEKTRR